METEYESRTAASVEDAANNLLEELNSGAMRLCVEHDASDDVAPALLRAARARVEAGSNVRVVCADAVAAARFRALAADDPLLGALDVVSVRELALSILGDARVGDAVDATRVLDEQWPCSWRTKVSGLKPGRLRDAQFFYKGISDCADDDERWLITAEEPYAILTEPGRAAVAAVRVFVAGVSRPYESRGRARARRWWQNFGSLSKASQRLVRHLATDGLVAAGRTLASSAPGAYPCFDRFRALADEADCLVTLACERPRGARVPRAGRPAAEFAFAAASVGAGRRLPARRRGCGRAGAAWGDASPPAGRARHRRGAQVRPGRSGRPAHRGPLRRPQAGRVPAVVPRSARFHSLRSWLGFGDWLLRSMRFGADGVRARP
ncbi:MAG: hypothetical protein ACLT98_08185 [Eggerthellaceae bacterium]